LIGLIAFIVSIKDINMAKKSSSWLTVKGVIINSSILKHESTYTTRWLERENLAHEKIEYTFEVYKTNIFYEYNINGIKYINNLISEGDKVWTDKEDEMNEIKKRYPEGSPATVFITEIIHKNLYLSREYTIKIFGFYLNSDWYLLELGY
jgi:hypothetical protein